MKTITILFILFFSIKGVFCENFINKNDSSKIKLIQLKQNLNFKMNQKFNFRNTFLYKANSLENLLNERKSNYNSLLFPVFLIKSGWETQKLKGDFCKFSIYETRNKFLKSFRIRLDDYLQFMPLGATLFLTFFSNEKDKINSRMKKLIIAEALMGATVHTMKTTINTLRPDRSTNNSFPSGHTAQAFLGASILHKEFGKKNCLISILGFSAATATGVLRVLNNRHWSSDVIAGAGIGILSTELIYLKKIPKNTFIYPTITSNSFELNFKFLLN